MGASAALSEATLASSIQRAHYAAPHYIRERFQKFIDVHPVTSCWAWTGTYVRSRAMFSVGYAKFEAARVAWVLDKGALAAAVRLRRTCSLRGCVSPHHHRVETRKERPTAHQRRLTPAEVAAIIRGYQERSVTMAELSRIFSVSPTTIWHIAKGHRRYAQLPMLPPPRTRRGAVRHVVEST